MSEKKKSFQCGVGGFNFTLCSETCLMLLVPPPLKPFLQHSILGITSILEDAAEHDLSPMSVQEAVCPNAYTWRDR